MQFKPLVGNVWSVRIGDHYRAVAQKHGDLIVWFWIGTHEEYNNFVRLFWQVSSLLPSQLYLLSRKSL